MGEVRKGSNGAYLQRHEERLALHIREAEVHAARVAVRVAVPDDVVDLRVNTVDETVRELLDA